MILVIGAVGLFSALLYLPTTGYRFVWDDVSLITANELIARSSPFQLFARGFWAGSPEAPEGAAPSFYRPLVNLSFWLDLKIAGPNPSYFHWVNMCLNMLAAMLVTAVLWELLRSGVWAAFGGFLFAAHSAHVESVAFVSGRTDLLLTIFIALAAFALLRAQRKRNRWWWIVLPPAYALALLSKETALLFPVLAGLAPLLTQTRYDRQHWAVIAATLTVGVAYLLLRGSVVSGSLPALGRGTVLQRLTVVANTFGLYIGMFLYPFNHRAKFPADPTFLNPTPSIIVAILFLVSIPLLALRRRFRIALWSYLWTIVFLLPVANILPLGPQAAERLLYLPSAGLVMLLFTMLSRLLTARARLRQVAGVIAAMTIVLLGADSMTRSRIWQDDAHLFSAMVREAPSAPSAYANLANAVASVNPDSAVGLYNRALMLDQGYVNAHINVAVLLSGRGDHRRAIHHLRLADELRPSSARVLTNLGLAFLAASEPESALAALDRAVAVEPKVAAIHLNLAAALVALGRGAESEPELQLALRLDSALAPARLMLSQQLETRGQLDSAADLLAAVVESRHPSPVHVNHLGTLLVRTGDTIRADACYRRALELDPDYVPALYNRAALRSAKGDSATALALATRAYSLRPDLEPVRKLYEELRPYQ